MKVARQCTGDLKLSAGNNRAGATCHRGYNSHRWLSLGSGEVEQGCWGAWRVGGGWGKEGRAGDVRRRGGREEVEERL